MAGWLRAAEHWWSRRYLQWRPAGLVGWDRYMAAQGNWRCKSTILQCKGLPDVQVLFAVADI
jgi:hypothetical protein